MRLPSKPLRRLGSWSLSVFFFLFLYFSLLLLLRPASLPVLPLCFAQGTRHRHLSLSLSLSLGCAIRFPSEAALLGMPMLAAQCIETGVVRLLQNSGEPTEFLSQTKQKAECLHLSQLASMRH